MTTLRTGQAGLSQVERSRQLAAALQQMAMSFEPIAHPYQGLAKMAQAWAAVKMNQASDARQEKIAKERQKALIDALSPVEIKIPGRGGSDRGVPMGDTQGVIQGMGTGVPPVQQAPPGDLLGVIQGMGGGAPQAGAGGLGPYGFQGDQYAYRPKTNAEMLAALPAEYGEEVTSQYLLQSMLANAGLTPQQLAAKSEGDLYTSVGTRTITIPGQEPFEAEVFREKGKPGRVGLLDRAGEMMALDTRWISGTIDRTMDVPFSGTDAKDFEDFAVEAYTAMNQIDRLKVLIVKGGLTQDTVVGGVSAALDNAASALAQAGLRMNRDQEGSMLDRGWWLQKKGTLPITDEDRQKYGEFRISQAESMFKRFSGVDAATQQIAISLAYTLARIADPGGRLSEMDVMNQMLALGLDQSAPERRLAALEEAEKTFAVQVRTRLNFAKKRAERSGYEPHLPEGMEARVNAILSDQSSQGGASSIGPADLVYLIRMWSNLSDEERALFEGKYGAAIQEARSQGLIQ